MTKPVGARPASAGFLSGDAAMRGAARFSTAFFIAAGRDPR
jgi:hypothetical protein